MQNNFAKYPRARDLLSLNRFNGFIMSVQKLMGCMVLSHAHLKWAITVQYHVIPQESSGALIEGNVVDSVSETSLCF